MINVVYMATPDISIKTLEMLYNSKEINLIAVITQPDRPKGRGNKLTSPPVKIFSMEHDILCFQTEKISRDKELIQFLKSAAPDFFVTFAFGQILSQEVLDIPKFAVVNLHASLLPKYRGANPIQRCIYNGDKITGITTMLTVLELDAGDICETKEIEITDNMTNIELKDIICTQAPSLIYSTLRGLYFGTIKTKKQSCDGITIAKKFNKNDGLIDWKNTACNIHNQVRSMVDFPCAYTFFGGKMIKILETRLTDTIVNADYASVVNVSKAGIEIKTGNGCILVTKVKPESKACINAFDYANGAKIKTNMKFGE